MAEFRFSPRPNRAAEINWHDWNNEAFDRAEKENKLILLAISGVWCHWCHVMDETSYSDPRIIALINREFVAIRVDTDRRPDINQRYNLGGWPTTAILNPDGELITGGTYLPPDKLYHMLTRVNETYAKSGYKLRQEGVPLTRREQRFKAKKNQDGQLPPEDLIEKIETQIIMQYDRKWGGFGPGPKFPMVETLLYAIDAYQRTGDNLWEEMFTRTMDKMATKGMYDHVEGGFFRYSTDREWRVPHYEKMLEDNAQLMGAYLRAWQVTGAGWFLDVTYDVFNYLRNNLFLPEQHAWAGSHDADEEYYLLDEKQRQRRPSPYIDRTIYTDWNALLAENLLLMGILTGVERFVDASIRTLEGLWARSWDPKQGLAHYFTEGKAYLYRQLADALAYGRAANLAYQVTGDYHWLERARLLADFCLFHLEAPEGGFYDSIPDESFRGPLSRPGADPLVDARVARWLLELGFLTGIERYGNSARKALSRWDENYLLSYGAMAAGFAGALLVAHKPWTVVTVVGEKHDQQARNMVNESLRQYLPHRVVRWIDPVAERALASQLAGPELPHQATAYICTGETCLPPAHTITELLKYQSEGFLNHR